jgi:MFS family permease
LTRRYRAVVREPYSVTVEHARSVPGRGVAIVGVHAGGSISSGDAGLLQHGERSVHVPFLVEPDPPPGKVILMLYGVDINAVPAGATITGPVSERRPEAMTGSGLSLGGRVTALLAFALACAGGAIGLAYANWADARRPMQIAVLVLYPIVVGLGVASGLRSRRQIHTMSMAPDDVAARIQRNRRSPWYSIAFSLALIVVFAGPHIGHGFTQLVISVVCAYLAPPFAVMALAFFERARQVGNPM